MITGFVALMNLHRAEIEQRFDIANMAADVRTVVEAPCRPLEALARGSAEVDPRALIERGELTKPGDGRVPKPPRSPEPFWRDTDDAGIALPRLIFDAANNLDMASTWRCGRCLCCSS